MVGGNSSAEIADTALLMKEYNYMIQLLKDKKMNLAKLLSNNCRYIDDISIINYKAFDKLVNKIYPQELIACRNGNDNKHIQYLDIDITVTGTNYQTKVFNKTEDFNFTVVNFPFVQSNIPKRVPYNVFYNELYRYHNICSNQHSFLQKTANTFNLLLNMGYQRKFLISGIKRFFNKYISKMGKFGFCDIKEIINQI